MILPKPDYRDPAEVAERHERLSVDLSRTCFRCLHRYLHDDAFRCMAENPGFPREIQETCSWFKRR